MKIRAIILTAVILLTASISFGQAKAETVQQLANRVSKAFMTKRFVTLDAGKPYTGRLKFVIDHSLSDKTVVKSFSSMKSAGDWLFRGRKEVGVNAGSLRRCVGGTCSFNQDGMLHNNLYLKKVTYGTSNGRPFLKALYFIDGD